MIGIVGLLVRWFDNLLVKSTAAPIDRRGPIGRVAAIRASAVLTDLYWVGSSTYGSRAGFRLLLILGIWIPFAGVRNGIPADDYSLSASFTRVP
jgi:hypothetical protein